MAKLRTAMDAGFWDLEIATPQNLDGCAKAVPGETFPMDGARASRALRVQQLSFLGNGFPLAPLPDITLNAAWPELFIDSKGRYWNVPESVSLDLLSNISESGLRYRFGFHKNGGQPQGINATDSDAPAALLPGLCAKAAFSYEKCKDLWRMKETKKDLIVETEKGLFWRPAYDVQLKEPHAPISTIIGGVCGAWLWAAENPLKPTSGEDGGGLSSSSGKRSPLSADLYGSVSSTFQHGKFRKPYGDLTRVDVRLDICSASDFVKNISSIFRSSSNDCQENSVSLPRLCLIFQQQVAGPIVFRIDSKCVHTLHSPRKNALQIEDVMYSLSYSLWLLESGKVVAWYSPKRKEGMIELRVFEF